MGFRHPMIAKGKGAKLIHVDPRFTRTSAMCDIYAPIRPGTDIAFLGGLINYVIENEGYFEEYVKRLHQRCHPGYGGVRGRGRHGPLLRLGRGEAASTTRPPGATRVSL